MAVPSMEQWTVQDKAVFCLLGCLSLDSPGPQKTCPVGVHAVGFRHPEVYLAWPLVWCLSHPWSFPAWVWRALLYRWTWLHGNGSKSPLKTAGGTEAWQNWKPVSWTPMCALLLAVARPGTSSHLFETCGLRLPQGTHGTGGKSTRRDAVTCAFTGTWSCQLCYFSLSITCGTPYGFNLFPYDHCWTSFQVLGCQPVFSLLRYHFKSFCLFLNRMVCFLTIVFSEFFIYSEHKTFVSFVFCKYFFLVAYLFIFLIIFQKVDVFNIHKVY